MHVRVWARTYTLELHGSPKIIAVAMELLQFYYDSYNKVTVFIACIYIYISYSAITRDTCICEIRIMGLGF